MAQRTASKRIGGTFLLILFILGTCAGFMGLKLETDKVHRIKVPGSSIIYIPSGKYLKYATFGYSALAADLVYLWAIQYYGTYDIADRFFYLDHIFSIIAELDPRYVDPYEVGSLIASQEARDPQLALKILDRGSEKNPDQWLFPFEAGHIAQIQLKDFKLAGEYFKKTMSLPEAPDFVRRLYANATYKVSDYRTAWELWLEIYKEAEKAKDERVIKIASNHLYQVKSAMDVDALKDAVMKYKAKYRSFPSDLDRLAAAGILTSVPKDLDDKDYVYDPITGDVKAPTIPWKR